MSDGVKCLRCQNRLSEVVRCDQCGLVHPAAPGRHVGEFARLTAALREAEARAETAEREVAEMREGLHADCPHKPARKKAEAERDAALREVAARNEALRHAKSEVERHAADAERQASMPFEDPVAVAGPWAWKRMGEILRGLARALGGER